MFRLALLILAFTPVSFGATVIMANGDRLTGEVQGIEDNRLVLKTSYAGVISIDRSEIVKISSDRGSAVESQLASGTAVARQESKRASQPGLAVPGKAPQAQSEEREELQGPGINADVEHIYTGRNKGNDLSVNLDVRYVGKRQEVFFTAHEAYSASANSTDHDNSQSGRWTYQYYLGQHPFAFSWFSFGHAVSSQEAHGLAQQYGGGCGWSFVRSGKSRLWGEAGVLYGHSAGAAIMQSEGGSQQTVPYDIDGPLFLAGLVGRARKFHGVNLTGQLYYFKPLDLAGHNQLGTDNELEIPLTRILSYTLRAYATTSVRQTRFFEPKNLVVANGISVSF